MDAIAHHLTAVYALIAFVAVPLAVFGIWRFIARHHHRQAEEKMRRGNQLHRNWLEASKRPVDQTGEN